jgi:hypothetical protein
MKDKVIATDSISPSSLQACRHANGRDWWVLVFSHNHDYLYTYLLEPGGISLKYKQEVDLYYPFGLGQSSFSADGSKYAIFEVIGGVGFTEQGHLSIFDFDRCTGLVSNLVHEDVKGESIVVGMSFSYDGRYIYTSNLYELHQYDVHSEDIIGSKKLVAISDGFESDYGFGYKVRNPFSFTQLGPDGKIYGPGGNTLHMHRIDYPDEEGEACTVRQHVINTVNNRNTIPNFPNFRLGPLDGSDCDTLGLDNFSVAKFRYEQDTTDHLNVRFTDLSYYRPESWSWDFGDGTTFEGRKPYWHRFPKNGVYKVCLTVSNENGSHTTCRDVYIGTSSLEDETKLGEVVSLYPNPTDGPIILTLSDYIPEVGRASIYDVTGRIVHEGRVYYGWNDMDLSQLEAGTYVWIVRDGVKKIGEGKVVVY